MHKIQSVAKAICVLACVAGAAMAHAEPGDDEEVAKARKDYADAMQGHDVGLQNAMKIELSVQLAKAKERARRKHHSGHVEHPSTRNSAEASAK